MTPRYLVVACALALSACANPQRLPVGISSCAAVEQSNGFVVRATVENRSSKPISSLTLSLAFYHDFRYAQFTAQKHFDRELDPGEKRSIDFDVSGPSVKESGSPMRCLATHIGYLDGTSADLGPSQ